MGVPAKLPSESTNKRFKNGKQATIYFKLYSVINLDMGCSKKNNNNKTLHLFRTPHEHVHVCGACLDLTLF